MKTLFIFTGPSGSGKTTAGNILMDKYNIHECISTTTRKKRKGEVNGVDYYFVNEEDFKKEDFIEINKYAGNLYGLSLKAVKDAFSKNPKSAFVVAEKHGAEQIKEYFKGSEDITVICIFFKTSIEKMREGMKKRGDKEENIVKRLNNALRTNELKVPSVADYTISANKKLPLMMEELYDIILKKERE